MSEIASAQDDKVGFEIGFDLALYRLPKPKTEHQSILHGFDHKKAKRGSTKHANKFVRKWLTLRLNAFDRNIKFSEAITPQYLEDQLKYAEGRCPITHKKLTFGTLQDTDWSVDRLLNDYGYVESNVLIMSTRANAAKGNLSTEEIKAVCDTKKSHKGLSHRSWQILHDICQYTHDFLGDEQHDSLVMFEGFDRNKKIDTFLKDITDEQTIENDNSVTISFVYAAVPKNKHKLFRRHHKRLLLKRIKQTSNPYRDHNADWKEGFSRKDNESLLAMVNMVDWDAAIEFMHEEIDEYKSLIDHTNSFKRD